MSQPFLNQLSEDILFKKPTICVIKDDVAKGKNIEISMLRLDEIHPIISGNKIFKLYYFLEEAQKTSHKIVITFGGAYSNHLAATAFACKRLSLKSIGFVRGEKPKVLSPTLLFCLEQKMQLEFISRTSYKKITDNNFLFSLKEKYGAHILIPEGGFSEMGAKGASLITQFFKGQTFTHVCLAVGTATTFAGIMNSPENAMGIMGFSVLKNLNDIDERLSELKVNPHQKFSFISDYHFGGYAKRTSGLISFINDFYTQHAIPLDFVYTGKMMYGVFDLIKKNYFPHNSKILCIHTGGLQGNKSLPAGTFKF
ncbi:MAG TPA: 1-aminocyclopropane-1-carboxylate deaminase [Hanamia sp.]|nr:1-aminocyclopropane-1-carboxylate deaminase [Hanamia sp.]